MFIPTGFPPPEPAASVLATDSATHPRARVSRIAGLYITLYELAPSPVVALNRAVAIAKAEGPAAGLALLDQISELPRYHLLHAARADLLRQLGRLDEATGAYHRAHALATNPADRRFLAGRLAEYAARSGREPPPPFVPRVMRPTKKERS